MISVEWAFDLGHCFPLLGVPPLHTLQVVFFPITFNDQSRVFMSFIVQRLPYRLTPSLFCKD